MKHKGLLLLLCIFSIINIEAQQNTYPLDFNPDNYTEKVIVKNKKEYKISETETRPSLSDAKTETRPSPNDVETEARPSPNDVETGC